MELTLKIINPINVFELPLGSQKVVDGDCSGLYCFKHKNIDKYGIGSALSCRSPKGGGFNKKLNLTQRRYYSTKKEENNYIPENIYENADIDKMQILDDNKNKAGVYLWINIVDGKKYIGSSENLKKRFREYFNVNHLMRNKSLYICSALLKYGYSKFSLEILEYCEPEKCLESFRFFAVNTKNGMVQYYANNSQVGNRGTVRRHRENNTVSKGGIRYINQDVFIKFYTEAIAKEGFICQLNLEQIRNLPNNPSKF